MRPLRISMKGFGAFQKPSDIDLSDVDLVALVGPTGSGKSTIIDAITFALYGTVARYEDNRLVAPAINQTSNEARVSLDFELDGQVLTATRIVRRTTSGGATTREARLERGGNVLAGDATSMSQEVEGLLGLDVEQFNRTVVLPQGKFATFLHDKPSDRQSTLVRLLGMELYRRIGRAARQRAAQARNHVDAIQPDFERETGELTDQRRAALETRIKELDAAHSRFKTDRETITAIDSELRDLDGVIGQLDDQLHRMAGIAAPGGLAELASRITDATRARIKAEDHRKDMNAKRRLANEALANGPNIADVRLGIEVHSDLARRIEEHYEVVRQLESAVQEHEATKRTADQVRRKREELDRLIGEAREQEEKARAARDAGTPAARVEEWERHHNRHETASKKAREAIEAARSAEASIRPLQELLEEAESAAVKSSARLAELRSRDVVLGHVHLLEVGSDCPLCLQEVRELPVHDMDADLLQAEADNERDLAARADAKQSRDAAEAVLIERRAYASSAGRSLRECEADIASIPPADQLEALRAEATGLTEAVRAAEGATRQAETAASGHRESATYVDALERERITDQRVTGLSASETTLRTQLTSLRAEAADLPSRDELNAQNREVERLRAELKKADSGFNEAEARYERLAAELEEVNRRHARATEHLHASRDRVAAFGPPTIDTADLVAAWTVLTDWIQDQIQAATSKRRAAIEQRTARMNSRSAVVHSLRELCIDVIDGVATDASVTQLGELLTTQRANSSTELQHFDRRRHKLEELRERLAALNDQALVATRLGQLLRTDGFESWLMGAALEQLVERATGRLLELSDGQYSLTLHKRDFAVRDHTNADEVRSARTLSGGETFLASLSLALAVADATAELAPEGAPRMESIFLDEGFGTLDPHTLDTVATAIEELGTTGRFVGIVTHIRELADRMPVRLEVTKTGGSASVERIET